MYVCMYAGMHGDIGQFERFCRQDVAFERVPTHPMHCSSTCKSVFISDLEM